MVLQANGYIHGYSRGVKNITPSEAETATLEGYILGESDKLTTLVSNLRVCHPYPIEILEGRDWTPQIFAKSQPAHDPPAG